MATVKIVSTTAGNVVGNNFSSFPQVSSDGVHVAFGSNASNFGFANPNSGAGIFVKDLLTGALTLVTHDINGAYANGNSYGAVFSGDGKHLAFVTNSSNFITGLNTGGDFFNYAVVIEDLTTQTFKVVTSDSTGKFVSGFTDGVPDLSEDGSFAVFTSQSKGFAGGNGVTDEVYRKNLNTGAVQLVSMVSGTAADGQSYNASISGNGNLVVFESFATNLVGGVSSGTEEIYVRDMTTNVITVVSQTKGGVRANGNDSGFATITPDGHYVVFVSAATTLGVNSGKDEVYRKDLLTGDLVLVSATKNGVASNGNTTAVPYVTSDGRYVLFESDATNLGTTTGKAVFLKDLDTGEITIVSGDNGTDLAGDSTNSYMDSAGSKAVFQNGGKIYEIDLNLDASGSVVWTKGSNGDFSKAANWTPTHVPLKADDAEITPAGKYTVTSSISETVHSLTTASGATLSITGGEFTILDGTGAGGGVNAGTISVTGGHLHLGGQLDNTGTLKIGGGKAAVSLILEDDVSLEGGGLVTLASNAKNSIVSNGTDVTLTNVDDRIVAAGTIGDSHLTLINKAGGTIDAASDILALTIDTGSHVIKNEGTLQVSHKAGLVLKSDIDNSGTIEASGNVQFTGTVNNTGSIEFGATGAFILGGDVTLKGGGTVSMADSGTNGIITNGPAFTLTNVDNTISGFGNINDSDLTLINQSGGTFNATDNFHPSFISTGVHTITNAGTIENTGLSSLSILSDLDNTGRLLAVNGNLLVSANITGNGLVEIDNNAIFELNGSDAGTITFGAVGTGTLKLDQPDKFTGTIAGLDIGDTIDLSNAGLLTAEGTAEVAHTEITGGQLVITMSNGSELKYDIEGNLSGNVFVVRDLPGGDVGLTLEKASSQLQTHVSGFGTGNTFIDSLIWGWSAWDETAGPITYWFGNPGDFADAVVVHGDTAELNDDTTIDQWMANQQAVFTQVLQTYASVSGLSFQQASDVASANITVWLVPKITETNDVLGQAEIPSARPDGHLWAYFADTAASWGQLQLGGDGLYTITHELLHLFGFSHPHDGGIEPSATKFPGVDVSADRGVDGQNQGVFTVLSYNRGYDKVGYELDRGGQGGLGAFDIAALQQLYGANPNAHGGDDVYALPVKNAAGTGWFSIWDTGGVDTIDNAASKASAIIDLREAPLTGPNAGGFVSYNSAIQGGVTIAKGVVIENAIGGSGADTITGNDADNLIIGGGGKDTMDGGGGNDTLSYANAAAGVTVNLLTGKGTAGDALGDVALNFEHLIGSKFNDGLTGNDADNIIKGGAGDDTIEGGKGSDTLDGEGGVNTLSYVNDTTGVTIDLIANTISGGEAEGDTISNFRHINGGSGTDKFEGTNDANNFNGNGGNDILSGRLGSDSLFGGSGDDQLFGGVGADTLDGGADTDTVSYLDAIDGVTVALGLKGAMTLGIGGDADKDKISNVENIVGGDGNDVLTGNTSINSIFGGDGDDLIQGGGLADGLDGGVGIDTVSYDKSTAGVVINLSLAGAQAGGGDGAGDVLANFENVIGSASADQITGDSQANILVGGKGNDILTGGDGDDVLLGGANADKLDGGVGNDTVSYDGSTAAVTINLKTGTGSGGDAVGDTFVSIEYVIGGLGGETLTAAASGSVLSGGGGNDTIVGGDGDDTLDGGGGISDTLSYLGTVAGVTVDLLGAAKQDTGGSGKDTLTGFENLTGGNGGDALTGNGAANVIAGGLGDDTISGGTGNDTLDGGAGATATAGGSDTVDYSYLIAGNNLTVTLGAWAPATGAAAQTTTSGVAGDIDKIANFENILGGGGNDVLTGNAGINKLSGGGGDDKLDGGVGADALAGGAGNDIYIVDNAGDVADETGGSGSDTVMSSVAFSLADAAHAKGAIENLILTGSAAMAITGNDLDNVLTGNTAANTLDGGLGDDILIGGVGADTLIGGGENDTASYASSAKGVTVTLGVNGTLAGSLALGGDAAGDKITGIANLTGSTQADILTGNELANIIDGGAGNDTIEGGGGDDVLKGNTGIGDLVTYAHASGAVTVALSEFGAQDTGGAGNDTLSGFENLTGSAQGDDLSGDGGINVILGGLGDDLISGGAGNDILDGGSGASATTGGSDTVDYSYLTGGNNLTVTLGSLTAGTGAVAQTTTSGVAGDIDKIANFENIIGGGGHDMLTGNAGANTITGGGGNDTLSGGAGDDILSGGTGNDLFRFLNPNEGKDTILDFNATTEIDKISIVKAGFGIPATIAVGAATPAKDFALHYFVDGAASAGTAPAATEAHGQFLFNTTSNELFWDSNGTAAGGLSLIATLNTALHATDFDLR